MKKIRIGLLVSGIILALSGCTTYDQTPPQNQDPSRYDDDAPMNYYKATNTCYVRDRKDRRWYASGRLPCTHALKKCEKWHAERGIKWSQCWVVK